MTDDDDVQIDIQVACAQPVDEAWLRSWALRTLEAAEQPRQTLTLRIVEREEIQALNRDYRGRDQATNVLSFPADWPEEIFAPYLGDIAICASVVQAQAQEQDKTAAAHWAHMVVHGVLHLCGYDHIEASDAEQMEALECRVLASGAITNPYGDWSHKP